jgi:Fibronectin type III domain
VNRRSRVWLAGVLLCAVLVVGTSIGLYRAGVHESPSAQAEVENDQLLSNPASSTGSCGVERWSVKTGTDADAGLVNQSSTTPTTIATMRGYAKPASLPANNRIQPQETTIYSIEATLTEYKRETDSDYHLVIKDASGNTMITEVPDPACASGSTFGTGIQNARDEFNAKFTPTSTFKLTNIAVRVRGIGFFDFLHGQTGVAPNGIELHPVLDILFNPGPINVTPPGRPANVVATAGDATADVSWNAPASDGGDAITSYTVTPYIGSMAQTPQIVTAPTTTASFTGLADGTTYWFTVAATNSVGTGAAASSYSVTPTSTATPTARLTAPSQQQYQLPNSDGVTWQDIDATNLSLSVTPTVDTLAIVSGNVDLFTANAGYNQDIGIWMNPGTATAGIVAWKESGGFAGTFSPNAAAVQTFVSLTANTTYSVKLQWKTNRPALGKTIFAGAGPIGGLYSPTRLSVKLVPGVQMGTAASVQQYGLTNNNGLAWVEIDATNLQIPLSATTDAIAMLGANVDLFTGKAGYNQDIGIFVSVDSGADQLVAWKESGGFAGTFSPNAAFVQGFWPLTHAHNYLFKLKWKTNRNASGATIYAGAGPIGGLYSPTTFTLQVLATASSFDSPTSQQYSLANNDGTTWVEISSTNLSVTVAPSADAIAMVGANLDLFTGKTGYNQDIGIFVSDNGAADQLLAWKESGGFAGTFSPNAAFVETQLALTATHAYVFKLKWKTNKNAPGATIYAGAGPISGQYSPTRLSLQLPSA